MYAPSILKKKKKYVRDDGGIFIIIKEMKAFKKMYFLFFDDFSKIFFRLKMRFLLYI